MAIIIYQRVSSAGQEYLRQEHIFKEKGIIPDKVYEEKVSAKDTNRPALNSMLEYVREGDTVYVESISRIARNTRDFLDIVDKLEYKKVQLVSLKEQIDTSTPTGRFLLSVFGALAQLERETIKERQKETIEARREKGLNIGRPKIKLSKTFNNNYKLWKDKKITAVDFMKEEKLSKTTFYRLIKEYETNIARYE